MKYYMPVKVFDEDECVAAHAGGIAALGSSALIVTGKRSAKLNGSFDDLVAALDGKGIKYQVFSDVEENPSTDTIFAARDAFAQTGIDLVIGVGGGSPMDAAKAIALVLYHPEADLDYLYDKSRSSSALPVVCIPTTCGTGSEVTGVSVLTRHDKKTKISMVHKVFPSLALIDGKYLASAPMTLIVNSSVDALAHLLESALNSKADDYVKMTAKAGLGLWARTKDILEGKREPQKEDLALLMRSSAMAGMSIAQSGTSIPHALSYSLTYHLGLPHGKAVGHFLPAFLEAAPKDQRDELVDLAGFSGLDDLTSFIRTNLDTAGIPQDELIRSYEAVKSNPAKMNSASFPVDENSLKKIAGV